MVLKDLLLPKHLVKEDGMMAKVDEKLMFKVIDLINQLRNHRFSQQSI